MTTRQRTMVWGTLLALALLGVAAMPVAWAMPAQQLGTVPTRTPTPGSVTNTPVPPPPTSAPVGPTATEEPPDSPSVTPTVGLGVTAVPARPTVTDTARPAPLTATSTVSPVVGLPSNEQGTPVGASLEAPGADGVPDDSEPKPDSVSATVTSAAAFATDTAQPSMLDVPSSNGERPEEAVRTTEKDSSVSWKLVVGALLLILGGGLFAHTRYRR